MKLYHFLCSEYTDSINGKQSATIQLGRPQEQAVCEQISKHINFIRLISGIRKYKYAVV